MSGISWTGGGKKLSNQKAVKELGKKNRVAFMKTFDKKKSKYY